jgi:hypothetical protein
MRRWLSPSDWRSFYLSLPSKAIHRSKTQQVLIPWPRRVRPFRPLQPGIRSTGSISEGIAASGAKGARETKTARKRDRMARLAISSKTDRELSNAALSTPMSRLPCRGQKEKPRPKTSCLNLTLCHSRLLTRSAVTEPSFRSLNSEKGNFEGHIQ